MKSPQYFLIDAVSHQKEAPITFELPPHHHRSTVGLGEMVKLMFVFPQESGDPVIERMWVSIIDFDGESYKGQLENEPERKGFIKKGDFLMFSERHVINIHPPRIYFGEKLTLE